MNDKTLNSVELLSPAGEIESACGAFANGADAVYFGLKRFSARAGAVNFSKDDVLNITSYAHQLNPKRKVYVAINTLIKEVEFPDLVEMLTIVAMAGVDGVIVQDLGVYHIVKRYFPQISVHASTQMAVHNSAGVRILKNIGFSRVVLAREMTLDEIKDASSQGIETEVFIHGALCYSYSGLCLYSALNYKQSANRGCCSYPCREFFESENKKGYLFSMKDLALLDDVELLVKAGVSSLKIEGRKRSINYVSAVTKLYRRFLDGNLVGCEKEELITKAKISFGRKWSNLYLKSLYNKDVVDNKIAGHLGVEAGVVKAFYKKGKIGYITFKSKIAFAKHDVLKVELPDKYKVFSFPVTDIFIKSSNKIKKIFEVNVGDIVDVVLPNDYPFIPQNSVVFCASSQLIKQDIHLGNDLKLNTPLYPLDVYLEIIQNAIVAKIKLTFLNKEVLEIDFADEYDFIKAEISNNDNEIIKAFSKFGGSKFYLANVEFKSNGFFMPLSLVKDFRRNITTKLEDAITDKFCRTVDNIKTEIVKVYAPKISNKINRIGVFNDYQALVGLKSSLYDFYEITVLIDNLAIEEVLKLSEIYQDKLRLLLPVVCRNYDYSQLQNKVSKLLELGFRKWEITGLWGFDALGVLPNKESILERNLDITSAWSLYVMNTKTAECLADMGVAKWTLCIEDDEDNYKKIINAYPLSSILTIFHNIPLFVSANNVLGKSGCSNLRTKKSQELIIKSNNNYCEVIPKKAFCIEKNDAYLEKLGLNFVKMIFDSNVMKTNDIINVIKT